MEYKESPFSWNVMVVSKDGFKEQYTVRANTSKELFEKVNEIKQTLAIDGYIPTVAYTPNAPYQKQEPSAPSSGYSTRGTPSPKLASDPQKFVIEKAMKEGKVTSQQVPDLNILTSKDAFVIIQRLRG